MKLYDLYKADPMSALLRAIEQAEDRGWRGALLWQGCIGTNGTSYGSYRRIGMADLKGRTYAIEWVDDAVSILWLDRMHDTTLQPTQTVPLEVAAIPNWSRPNT